MVGIFIRLKLRLLRNVFRSSGGTGLFLFAIAALAAGILAAVELWEAEQRTREAAAPILATVLIVGWLLGPLLLGASDETIDTTRLALFPLSARPLALGMAASGLIGIGPIAGSLPLLALAARAEGVTATMLGVLATFLTLLVATSSSRWLLTMLGNRLRQRRSRDLATIITGLTVGVVGLFLQAVSRLGPGVEIDRVESIADIVRWTPAGWVGEALAQLQRGERLGPIALLVATTGLVVFVLWRWTASLERALTEVDDGGTDDNLTGHLVRDRGPLSKLDPRLAAVFAKERRYLVRHPRYRIQVVSQGTVLLIGGAPFLSAVVARNPEAVLMGCVPALTAGITGSNLLGTDGRALWAEVMALPRLRIILRGRSMAFVALGLVASLLVTLGVATWTGGWRFVPVALGAAVGMAFTGSGVGAYTSTLAPTLFPDEDNPNPFATTAPGQGCVNGVTTMAGVFIGLLLALPILGALALSRDSVGIGLATAAVAPFYGFAIWFGVTNLAGRRIDGRAPDLLEQLATL